MRSAGIFCLLAKDRDLSPVCHTKSEADDKAGDKNGDRCIANLLRLNSILSDDVLGDTCHLFPVTISSASSPAAVFFRNLLFMQNPPSHFPISRHCAGQRDPAGAFRDIAQKKIEIVCNILLYYSATFQEKCQESHMNTPQIRQETDPAQTQRDCLSAPM